MKRVEDYYQMYGGLSFCGLNIAHESKIAHSYGLVTDYSDTLMMA